MGGCGEPGIRRYAGFIGAPGGARRPRLFRQPFRIGGQVGIRNITLLKPIG